MQYNWLIYLIQMEDNQYEEEQYRIPPPQLQYRPVAATKSIQQSVVPLSDNFKEEVLAVDESSLECLEFLSEGTYLAVGCSNGLTKIQSTAQGNTQFILKSEDRSPVTAISSNRSKTQLKHALMLTHSEGSLEYWHATSRQLLFTKKYDEMLHTCAINSQGTHYAFAGGEGHIRFGNIDKGDPTQVEQGHLGKHQNRIFCLKWNPEDSNILLSGGWDRAVHFWDIRLKTSVNKLFGYYIGGQAIDFKGNQILLGSNSAEGRLKIYDIAADKIRSVQWNISEERQAHYTTGVLSCFFGQQNTIIACTPKNQVRLFSSQKCVSEYKNREEDLHLYCMQKDLQQRRVVTGWSDGGLRWLSY